jgi:hypothetical protein
MQSNFWNSTTISNESKTFESFPIERYTLSDNPDGLTSHFGPNQEIGAGSGGTLFVGVGSFITSSTNMFPSSDNNLLYLDPGLNHITLNVTMMTEWVDKPVHHSSS